MGAIHEGLLSQTEIITTNDSDLYNLNKFLTDDERQLYTRYKYMNTEGSRLVNIFTDKLFRKVDIEAENKETTYKTFPNSDSGGIYYFTESVCISIGGGTVYLTSETGSDSIVRQTETTGGINVL